MRMRGQTWCWIALWASVLALCYSVWRLTIRIERFENPAPKGRTFEHG